MTRARHETDVAVSGGMLRVGVWEADVADAPTALLIHGVTASHMAWLDVAERLPGVRLIAPDLRGRGRSSSLRGPGGMAAHAADMAAVLRALEVERTVVVGHSMGAFVAVVFADLHPDRVDGLVLIDGGLPLDVPAGIDPDTAVARVLGPTAERLQRQFDSLGDYLDFWRSHPAFENAWTSQLEEYLAYDLVADGTAAFRPATSYATVVDDTVDMNTSDVVPDALGRLRHPTRLVTVPRGLQNETPGLYAPDHLARVLAGHPTIAHRRIDGFNHYTIVMSPQGADVTAAEIADAVGVSAAPTRSVS